MKITKRETVFDGKYLKVKRKHFTTKTGKKGVWEMAERKRLYTGRVVIIFALTKKKEVILEKIYRVPIECYTIELPAGLTDRKGESERKTAKRELLEETGFKAKKMIPIISSIGGDSSLANSEMIYFFAPDVKFVGGKGNDEGEEIEVLKVPVRGLVDFILNPPQKTKIDSKILAILPILKKKKLI